MKKYKSILLVVNDVPAAQTLFLALGLGIEKYKPKVITLLPTMTPEEQVAIKYLIDDDTQDIIGIVATDDEIQISGAIKLRFNVTLKL